ncbi:MAG: hypothetical protein HYU58_05075 [Proteobacteria bacterium]|nr:hypothetical protein [Pseudomonadota bacterium]
MWHVAILSALSVALLSGATHVADAEDQLEVSTKVEDIEVFERVVLGRGLRADWATARLDLLKGDVVTVHAIVGRYRGGYGDLSAEVEKAARKIQDVATMTTGRQVVGDVTTEHADNLGAACEAFLKSGTRAPGRNTILVAPGDDARDCATIAELSPFSLAKMPGDQDLGDERHLNCASRSRSAADGNGKTTVIAASPKGNKGDIYLLRYCLFDRSFSFFGFRGRLVYASAAREDLIESLRSVPHFSVIPGTADVLMLALAYQYLDNGADYMAVRDQIKKRIGKLKP